MSDFGLTKNLRIQWKAPEILQSEKFSTNSDVWSYGIVLWEMFNPDHVPYEEYTNIQAVIKIIHGVKLKSPSNCPENISKIMSACWKETPSDRPTFLDLRVLLSSELANRHYKVN